MFNEMLDTAMKPVAKVLEYNLESLGVNNSMKIARTYNRLKYGKYQKYRKGQFQNKFDELIRENGLPVSPLNEIKDGWALDTLGRLPHLQQLLKDADEIIKERGGVKRQTSASRPFFQEIPFEDLFDKYPSILDFATSSDVLSVVCKYLHIIPVFSKSVPFGIRFNESWAKFVDSPPDKPTASQLFHLDYHDSPMVYVIVVLRDISMENGPFCFLPEAASQKAAETLNYGARGVSHRMTDEDIYSVVPQSDLIKLCYPAGTVLFLDNSKCFHFGSRKAVNPRYMLMYAYMSACRTDFGEVIIKRKEYPIRDSDSPLRKMVIRRELMI